MKRKTVQVSVAPIIINEKLGDFLDRKSVV